MGDYKLVETYDILKNAIVYIIIDRDNTTIMKVPSFKEAQIIIRKLREFEEEA